MILCVDVKCPEGHVNEVFIDKTLKTVTCPQPGCNEVAERIISPVRCSLDPCSGDFPGATMKWQQQREQRMALENKAAEKHGPDARWDVAKG